MGAEGLSRVPSPEEEDWTAEAAPARRGRPPHRPTGETRRQVEAMAALFLSQGSLGTILGVSNDSLGSDRPVAALPRRRSGAHGLHREPAARGDVPDTLDGVDIVAGRG